MNKVIFLALFVFAALGVQAQSVESLLPLAVGSKAPAFTAQMPDGQAVSLKEMLAKGPVVLVFYRGAWCPYCNRHLNALQDSLNMLQAKGAQVLAVTPTTLENVAKTKEKTGATFPIVSDQGMKIMQAYNVRFAMDQGTIERYKGYGMNMDKINGQNGANLPIPATYVIGQDGSIQYVHFDSNYAKRSSVKAILAAME